MDLGLSGLKALVTSASKGLGFATAIALLLEGVDVMINSRSPENLLTAMDEFILLKKESQIVVSKAGDVTDSAFCKELINHTNKTLGGFDILITNSGGPPTGIFDDLTIGQWEDAINLSFKSHLYLIKHSISYLKNSKFPSVLAIASFTIKNQLDNLILSNTVRAATVALIKSLSLELGYTNIRFNAILPGWTITDRVQNLLEACAKDNNSSIDQEKKKIVQSIPLGRMASPREFANVATFLVSPAASYVNGVLLSVDGGITRGLL